MKKRVSSFVFLLLGLWCGLYVNVNVRMPQAIQTQNKMQSIASDIETFVKTAKRFPMSLKTLSASDDYDKDGWGHKMGYVVLPKNKYEIVCSIRSIDKRISHTIVFSGTFPEISNRNETP